MVLMSKLFVRSQAYYNQVSLSCLRCFYFFENKYDKNIVGHLFILNNFFTI